MELFIGLLEHIRILKIIYLIFHIHIWSIHYYKKFNNINRKSIYHDHLCLKVYILNLLNLLDLKFFKDLIFFLFFQAQQSNLTLFQIQNFYNIERLPLYHIIYQISIVIFSIPLIHIKFKEVIHKWISTSHLNYNLIP